MTLVFPNIDQIETERKPSSSLFQEGGVDDLLKAWVVNLTVSSDQLTFYCALGVYNRAWVIWTKITFAEGWRRQWIFTVAIFPGARSKVFLVPGCLMLTLFLTHSRSSSVTNRGGRRPLKPWPAAPGPIPLTMLGPCLGLPRGDYPPPPPKLR